MSQHNSLMLRHKFKRALKEMLQHFRYVATFDWPYLQIIMKLRRNNYFYMSRQSIKEGTNPRAVVVMTFNEWHNKTVYL